MLSIAPFLHICPSGTHNCHSLHRCLTSPPHMLLHYFQPFHLYLKWSLSFSLFQYITHLFTSSLKFISPLSASCIYGCIHTNSCIFQYSYLSNRSHYPRSLLFICLYLQFSIYFFYQAQHKETKQPAALKQVALEEEEDLETFMIEIDILAECKHENIVELLEAYHYDGKLWVCFIILSSFLSMLS